MSIEGGGPNGGSIGGGIGGVATGGLINEGPFKGSLEGFRPMNVIDIKTIADTNIGGTTRSFAQKISSGLDSEDTVIDAEFTETSASDAVAEIGLILAQARNPLTEEGAVKEAEHWLGTAITKVEEPVTYPLVVNKLNYHYKPNNQPLVEDIIDVEARVLEENSTNGYPNVGVITHPQTQANAEALKSQILETKIEQGKGEEIIYQGGLSRKKFLVDKSALSNRILGIIQAVKKAKEVTGIFKIPGRLINKFWVGERDPQNLSQAVKPEGPDGSIAEIREIIDSKEFGSVQEAEKESIEVAQGKKPVKEGKINEDGEDAGDENVRRVFKFHLFKPAMAHEVVTNRVVKKLVPEPVVQSNSPKVENRLEDYPNLVEVFK